jgi:hypothetical protein
MRNPDMSLDDFVMDAGAPGGTAPQDPIAEMALALLLDHPGMQAATDKRAREILGRDAQEPTDEDSPWWDAKTKAFDELLDRVKQLNFGASS